MLQTRGRVWRVRGRLGAALVGRCARGSARTRAPTHSHAAAASHRDLLFAPLSPGVVQAHPVIADYPFTTLHPHVGVCAFADGSALKVADIPGLIEGAHEDRGLGHEFLRHIERTRVLCYVVDASAANADPAGDLASLQEELRLYDPRLPRRPALVVANKADLPGAAAGAARLRAATRMPVVEVSARLRRGAAEAVEALRWLVDAAARAEANAGARGLG
jgi:GTP-binding protein